MHDDMVKNAEASEVRGSTTIEISETCTHGTPVVVIWQSIGRTLKTDTFFSHVLHVFFFTFCTCELFFIGLYWIPWISGVPGRGVEAH